MTDASRLTLRAIGALLLSSLALPAAALAAEPAAAVAEDPRAALDALKSEFAAVKTALESAREAAMDQPSVKDALAATDDALKAAMLEESPRKSDAIGQYFDALGEHSALEAAGDEDGAAKVSKTLDRLIRKLGSTIEKANATPAVQAAHAATSAAILAAMRKVEPETPALMEKQRQLMARYQALQKQMGDSKSS